MDCKRLSEELSKISDERQKEKKTWESQVQYDLDSRFILYCIFIVHFRLFPLLPCNLSISIVVTFVESLMSEERKADFPDSLLSHLSSLVQGCPVYINTWTVLNISGQ